MSDINEVDRRVIESLSGGEKIKALLKARGMHLKDFARKYNHWVSEVSRCFSGEREYGEIRDAIAEEFGWSREQVDDLIDGPSPAEVA